MTSTEELKLKSLTIIRDGNQEAREVVIEGLFMLIDRLEKRDKQLVDELKGMIAHQKAMQELRRKA